MSTLKEALDLVDEIKRDLRFYNRGSYKQLQEQTTINKSKDLLEKAKTCIMAKDATDGVYRADKLSADEWRKITDLLTPLARCFTVSTPPVPPTTKTKHGAATAVAALALLSSCNQVSKMIVNEALETGVVDAFVNTLKYNLRNPTTDRVAKAMLYKLIESLWGFTLYASPQQKQDMVARDVVNVCLDLVTAPNVETESRLNANKTLHNCLDSQGRVVTELRNSKVTALNNLLQQLASQVPAPAAAGAGVGGSGASRNISMPVLLPAVMSWIWLLPNYILDHLLDSLARTLGRVVALVWPAGCPDVPSEPAGPSDAAPTDPVLVAQNSLPNRSLQKTLQNLFKAIGSEIVDPRLVAMLRGARLPAPDGADPTNLNAAQALQGTGLPARLVQVVREGRPDGPETRVALELLDELFACNDNGFHPELADDTIAAGLLGSMTEMGVLDSLRTEAGLAGVSSYVRLSLKLVKRAPYTHHLPTLLRDSGVPASVAYVAFWPTGKWSLKLEALQTLHAMVQLNTDMTERVVAMNNFAVALTNTLLGGDPEVRRPAKKSSSKKKAGATAAAAMAAGDMSAPNSASRTGREQIQDLAFEILSVVLDVAKDSDKVWETVVVSGMLPRLVKHSCAFPMKPLLLAELLGAVGAAFKDHIEDIATVGPLQAACAPHLLPLLTHEDPVVMEAAASVLLDVLTDMKQYRSNSADVAEGDDILRALVAAGPAIDSVAKQVAAPGGRGDASAGMPSVKEDQEGAGAAGEGNPAMDADAGTGPSSGDVQAAETLVRGPSAMEVDMPTAAAAAERTTAAAAAGADLVRTPNAPDTVDGRATGTTVTATNADAAAASEATQAVDVTTHGLGLMCRAMQSCISAWLQVSGTGAPASPLLTGGRTGSAVSTASSSRAEGTGKSEAEGESASRTLRVPEALDGPVFETLEALLESCEILGRACLEMPSHGVVRRHMACAFAYAKPAAEELVAALQAVPEPKPGHKKLQQSASEVIAVLLKIPVLDVALLPKATGEEDEEILPGPSPSVPARKGRPGASSKRPSQENLPEAIAAAQPAQQPNKRQRTASTAHAGAAAETDLGPIGRTRSASLANNGEGVPTLTPRSSARAASAAGAGQPNDTKPTEVPAPDRRPGPGDGRDLPGGGGAAAAGPLSRAGSEGPGASAAAGGATADPVMPAQPVGVGGAGSLGLPLSALPTPIKAPPPKLEAVGPRLPPLSGSPRGSQRELRPSQGAPGSTTYSDSQGEAVAAAAAATGTSGGVGGGGGAEAAAAAKGRFNAAEFRARYLEMKTQHSRMSSELEEQKRLREGAEARQRETAVMLATRTQELAQTREKLVRKATELVLTRRELAALRAELQEAREATSAASAAVAEVNEGLRELEMLRAENAGLKEENAKLNAELASLADLDELPVS